MKYFFIGLSFLLALFLQATLTTLPVVLIILLLCYIYCREEWVFFLSFTAGIFLDLMQVRVVGLESIFFLFFLFFVFLYQRKFEIGSYYFIFLILFLGSFLYGVTFAFSHAFFMAIVTAVGGIFSFWVVQKIQRIIWGDYFSVGQQYF